MNTCLPTCQVPTIKDSLDRVEKSQQFIIKLMQDVAVANVQIANINNNFEACKKSGEAEHTEIFGRLGKLEILVENKASKTDIKDHVSKEDVKTAFAILGSIFTVINVSFQLILYFLTK